MTFLYERKSLLFWLFSVQSFSFHMLAGGTAWDFCYKVILVGRQFFNHQYRTHNIAVSKTKSFTIALFLPFGDALSNKVHMFTRLEGVLSLEVGPDLTSGRYSFFTD